MNAPTIARPTGETREARLRAEHAQLYAGCPANIWVPAADAAVYVRSLGEVAEVLQLAVPPSDGRLNGRHFEFRGGNQGPRGRRTARTRANDRRQPR